MLKEAKEKIQAALQRAINNCFCGNPDGCRVCDTYLEALNLVVLTPVITPLYPKDM